MQNKKKGIFISFEGIDGSGKSTQIKKIKDLLNNHYEGETIFTREPGGTIEAELIRNLLLKLDKKVNFEPKSEILLLLASRYEHFKKLIEPAILKGKIVICDRFADSTLAYQCSQNKKLKDFYMRISKNLIYNFQPDLTIFLDLNPDEAFKRVNKRNLKNRYDSKNRLFFINVRKAYKEIASENKRVKTLNALKKEDELADEIKKIILDILN